MHIAFLDSWLQTSAEGSGTAVAIGGLQHALERQGVRVSRLAPPASNNSHLLLRRLIFNMKIPWLLQKDKYDLVIGFDIDGFLVSRWSARKIPYLVSVKGVLAEEARQERGTVRFMLWSLSRLERRNTRKAQGVLTTSAYCRNAIGQLYGVAGEQIRIVPEGIDLARWQRIAATTPYSGDGATILCVARQYPRKHIGDLLHAVVLVRKVVPQVRAIIVGDGPEHPALQRMITVLGLEQHVRLLGSVPDDDEVARIYRQADIFCLPSVQEGFGIAFLEAMASGLPIVATSATAIPEVVPNGQAGLLVPPGDQAALAQALIELLQNTQRRKELGDFGRSYVERFDWQQVAKLFLEQVQPFLGSA